MSAKQTSASEPSGWRRSRDLAWRAVDMLLSPNSKDCRPTVLVNCLASVYLVRV